MAIGNLYLLVYNSCQLANFSYIVCVMLREACEGREAMAQIYKVVGSHLKCLFLLQFMEVIHPAIGLSKGNPIFPMIQNGMRSFILFALIDDQPEVQRKWNIFYLLFVWCLVEVFRYPYYITTILKKDIRIIKGFRYTVWIPLYPLGIMLENVVFCQNIRPLEKSLKYSISLPNAANISFHFPTFIRMYLSVFVWIGGYVMLSHMYAQMKRALFADSKTKKSD